MLEIVTYFIQAEDGGPIKIGRSTRYGVAQRLCELQTGNPHKLVIRRVIDGDQEERLHYRHRDLRLQGEWFTPGARLAEYANAISEPIPTDSLAVKQGYNDGFRAGHQEATTYLTEAMADHVAEVVRRELTSVAVKARLAALEQLEAVAERSIEVVS